MVTNIQFLKYDLENDVWRHKNDVTWIIFVYIKKTKTYEPLNKADSNSIP